MEIKDVSAVERRYKEGIKGQGKGRKEMVKRKEKGRKQRGTEMRTGGRERRRKDKQEG